ncbi:MAG: sterol desaturase family protein [Gammaproteobacteria bacterium]|nr:sterol desaturase family protein [Gammaproteobacteria bacterium]
MSLNEFVISYEKEIRMGFFFGMLVVIGLWEIVAPRRALTASKAVRWINNLGLVFFNSFIVRLVFPMAAVGVATVAQQNGWGLFNIIEWPLMLVAVLSIVIMDFVIYLQHVMVHAIPVLWRLHRVHHADPDYDVTTGARFHTLEIMLSMGIKFCTIVLLGPPVFAVIIFEVILNATAMFNHGNIGLPKTIDRILRWFIVTPDMHRVHHSIEDDETNSNFGFSLTWWDRIFGTYREQPRAGHKGMTIGIRQFKSAKEVSWISGMLTLPFKGKITDYAINRRHWSDSDNESKD